jgi:hypothetical protein|tara:strand:+ start:1145 stop:1819 length:675 start_codon:yes stop_codon:yes gene_type:complete
MEESPFDRSHFFIDTSNLMYCFNTFLRALKSGPKVSFGYDHDSILFAIDKEENIDLINIDQHDDVFHGMGDSPDDEYEMVTKYGIINEGNWGIWLHSVGRLNSFTWIMNDNSDPQGGRNARDKKYLGDSYQYYLKQDYQFDGYDFDHIFVCLSPQYTHPDHWHYFSMFISAYEEFSGNDAIIHTEKYETHVRHQRLHNEILHQCSDGRRPLPSEGLREWKALRK